MCKERGEMCEGEEEGNRLVKERTESGEGRGEEGEKGWGMGSRGKGGGGNDGTSVENAAGRKAIGGEMDEGRREEGTGGRGKGGSAENRGAGKKNWREMSREGKEREEGEQKHMDVGS